MNQAQDRSKLPAARRAPLASAATGRLVARVIAFGATPNMISYAGLLFAVLAALSLAVGAGHAPPWEAASAPVPASFWPALAGMFLAFAAASDLLDGAVARGGNLESRFGAVLDSTLDRLSDIIIFTGCVLYFTRRGNLTYVLLSCAGTAGSVLVSYVKARAEQYVGGLGIGYWQRGERCGLLLLAALLGRIPTALWILAIFPLLTAYQRARQARELLAPLPTERTSGRLAASWRRRGTAGYNILSVMIALIVLVAPWIRPEFYGATDPLGTLLHLLLG